MTYILGARCKDGIVIVSDSRVSRGLNVSRELKTFQPIEDTIVAASGVSGVFQKFLTQIESHVDSGNIKSWDELITVIEDVVLKLNQRYYDRANGETIEVLMGFKNSEDDAELCHITPAGIAEKISQNIGIGHGEPYGSMFLKTMWDMDMTMRETAELGSLIIKTITEEGLDTSVDDIPQIGFIPFTGGAHFAEGSELVSFSDSSQQNYYKFEQLFKDFKENFKIKKIKEQKSN